MLLACFCVGTAILQALHIHNRFCEGDRFILAEWIGLLSLAISSLSVTLFVPLSLPVSLGLGTVLLSLALSSSDVRLVLQQTWKVCPTRVKLSGFLGLCAIALYATRSVTWIDTGLYHIGTIKWLVQYGTVPGVALIHDRLGFASSWFSLIALFNPELTGMRAIAIPNGFVAILSVLHLLIGIRTICRFSPRLADWFIVIANSLLIFLFLGSTLFIELLASASPDIPIIFLTILTAWLILVIQDPQTIQPDKTNATPWAIAILPLFFGIHGFAIKLTAIPLLVMTLLFYSLHVRFHFKALLKGAGLTVLLLLPIAIFGQITSGCPFYPSTLLCTDVPWSLATQLQGYALAPTVGIRNWFPEVLPDTRLLPWAISFWLGIEVMNQVMAALLLLSLALMGYMVWRWGIGRFSSMAFIPLLGLLGSLFITVLSPGIRFGLGYLAIIPVWGLAKLLFSVTKSRPHAMRRFTHLLTLLQRQSKWISWVLMVIYAFGFAMSLGHSGGRARLAFPPALPMAEVTAAQLNDVHYVYPATPEASVLCWGAELPCSTGPIQVNIRLRQSDAGLSGGFEYAP